MESLLLKYIKKTYLPERFRKAGCVNNFTDKDVQLFAGGAMLLSEFFTSGRKELPRNYFNKKELRSAYLLYFTLTNFAKVIKCLWEIKSCLDPRFRGDDALKILDLGCGPGTASIACSDFFANRPVSITAVDQNPEILNDAASLFSILGKPNHQFRTSIETINPNSLGFKLKSQRFDIVIAANILNEIGPTDLQLKLCQTVIGQHLKPNGVFIIIDPALQKTTRALMEVRDHLRAKIISPCLHQQLCPMLAQNRRDWCHFYLEWKCPEIIRKVDHLLGIKHDYLKMAYLILRKASTPSISPLQRGRDLWRVVSSPLRSKGKCEFVLCGGGQLKRFCRLDKNRSKYTDQFNNIKRGDIVRLEGEKVFIESLSIYQPVPENLSG